MGGEEREERLETLTDARDGALVRLDPAVPAASR